MQPARCDWVVLLFATVGRLRWSLTHEELAKPSIAAQVTRAGGHGEQFHVMIGDPLVEVTS